MRTERDRADYGGRPFDVVPPVLALFNNKDVVQPLPCPGAVGIGPSKWGEPDAPAGSFACGTLNNLPAVMWTKDSGPYFGAALGNDLNALMSWSVATIETPQAEKSAGAKPF